MTFSLAVFSMLIAGASAPAPECDVSVALTTPGADLAGTEGVILADDADRARAACKTARGRFAELLGEPVPSVRVVLWDRPGYRVGAEGDQAAVFWPGSGIMAARLVDPAQTEAYLDYRWGEVLPHEIAHALLTARYFDDAALAAHDGYGTPFPDWFDEAVAIWAEPLETRRRRLDQARTLPARQLELASILAAGHPAAGDERALAIRDGAAIPPDEALRDFYPQSIAVLAFIYEAGGRPAVTDLAERLRSDPTDHDALLGLPGLPGEAGSLIEAWHAWLGEGRPAGP